MNKSLLTIAALFVATLPYAAHAQGTVRGAQEGAAAGDRAAGPLGAIVGGTVGAVTGTVGGILGVQEPPRYGYVIQERTPSFWYGDVRVGALLPADVTLYAVPREYREYRVRPSYRYAIVNDRRVIVEPRSRRIVEIIE